MNEFIITTDSNSDLPSDLVKAHDTIVIPQYYAFGDTVYGDELQLTPSEFYAKMREGALPTTMANNPEVIKKMLTPALEAGKDVLHLAFSSALSGSCQNVQMVAQELLEEYPDRKIIVIDTLTVSLGETLLFIKAQEKKASGATLEETAAYVTALIPSLKVYFTVDDLHHLQRGGRISKTTAILGSMINVKPILAVSEEGKLLSSEKARGRKKSILTIINKIEELTDSSMDRNSPIGVIHGDCIEDAKYAASVITEKLGFTNIIINDVSPSLGSHAGPGVLGFCFFTK